MAVWYDAIGGAEREDAAWELYHENSKHGRRSRPVSQASRPPRSPGSAGEPVVPLGDPTPQGGATPAPAVGPTAQPALTLAGLSGLLSFGATDPADGDLVETWVHVAGPDGLADGLYRHNRSAAGLRRSASGNLAAGIAAATLAAPSAAILHLMVVGKLARAFEIHGERGYRRALMSAGARMGELALAAAGLGFVATSLEFYDRDVDALLGLDGLAEGVLAVAAVTARPTG